MKIPSHSQEKFSIEHGSESINETKQDATFHVVQEPRSYVHLQKEEPHNIKPDTRDIRTINTDQDHNENSLLTANTPPANIYNEPLVQEEHNTTVIPDPVHLENPQDCSHITPVVNELPSPRDEQVQLAVVDTNDTVAEPPKDQQTDEQPRSGIWKVEVLPNRSRRNLTAISEEGNTSSEPSPRMSSTSSAQSTPRGEVAAEMSPRVIDEPVSNVDGHQHVEISSDTHVTAMGALSIMDDYFATTPNNVTPVTQHAAEDDTPKQLLKVKHEELEDSTQ